MSTYVVTFRIADKTISGKTWNDRYNQLQKNLVQLDKGYWRDPTSFYLVESYEDTNAFAKRIVRGLDPSADMLFTFDPKDMSACYFGDVNALDILRSFFPKARRVS